MGSVATFSALSAEVWGAKTHSKEPGTLNSEGLEWPDIGCLALSKSCHLSEI